MNETSSPDNPRLLLVDDDRAFRNVYVRLLARHGYIVDQADDRPTAQAAFLRHPHDLVLLDLMLPPDGTAQGGIGQLRDFVSRHPRCKVIVVSGVGDQRAMVDAVREGAYDFITKPAEPDVLLTVLQRAVQRIRLEAELEVLRTTLSQTRPSERLVGGSPAFLAALSLAERFARSELPVLILGENGTGKELFARLVHDRSAHSTGPFVTVNCGAIPEQLFESTFFGHQRGSFTGAIRERRGLFAEAEGGTLFLDEVGDLPFSAQVKLLRTLESGEVLPVGADRPVQVDVRIVSATNRDLEAMRTDGAFRDDLYWRINGAEIMLPPLRQRGSDIPLLATFFLTMAAALAPNGQARRLSADAERLLLQHDWPGNLRELKHEMQRATVLAGHRALVEAKDLSFFGRVGATYDPSRVTESQPACEPRPLSELTHPDRITPPGTPVMTHSDSVTPPLAPGMTHPNRITAPLSPAMTHPDRVATPLAPGMTHPDHNVPHPDPGTVNGTTLQEKIDALERQELERALRRYEGNRTHAAQALGLSRQGLLKKMQRHGIE